MQADMKAASILTKSDEKKLAFVKKNGK